MVKAAWMAILAIVAAMLVAGCGVQPGTSVLTIERNSTTVPPLTTVDKPAYYALFAGEGITPLERVYLNKGDQFGFQFRDGKIVGVYTKAGATKTIALDGILSSDYLWKYQGEK